MQYGNFEDMMKKIKETEGLNRTMQYGNPSGEPELSSAGGRFKSYYVVWKHI